MSFIIIGFCFFFHFLFFFLVVVANSPEQLSPKPSEQNYSSRERHRNSVVNGKEDSDLYVSMSNIKDHETKPRENKCSERVKVNVTDSEAGVGKVYNIPQRFRERREAQYRRKKHRCKKSSQANIRHSRSHYTLSDNVCEDNALPHSPDCYYYNHCSLCHHCHGHCCCHSHCCCFHCCFNWWVKHFD
jgi:hypothetical protein